MAEPGNAPSAVRERLLAAGMAVARRSGLRALTVRGLAQRTRVNLGSFVYHFGSRDAFVDELIERWYAPLMDQLRLTLARELPPRERLRHLILQLVDWVRANSGFVTHLVMDAAAGEKAARRFLRSLAGRHPALILQALRQAQSAGVVRRDDPLHLLLFVIAAMGLPVLLAEGLGGRNLLPPEFAAALVRFTQDRAQIEKRLDWVLQGLAPQGVTR